jgi:predicted Zn-dependent protease
VNAVRHGWRFAAFLTAVSACAVSDDQEVQLGRQYVSQINAQLPLVADSAVTGYVQNLGLAIASRTSRASLDWRFHVVNAREVNAFAVPGGFIYVNRGLIDETKTLAELAGVLGHEIGHVVRRHSVEQMKKQTGTNIGLTLLCTLTNICSSTVAQVAINVGGSALFAKYSRNDEAEADSEAVVNVMRAGIDPRGIPTMFATLMRERRAQPTVVDAFFASHPMEESRIEHTRALVTAIPEAELNRLTGDDDAFHAFKTRIQSLPPPPQRVGLPR